MMQFNPNIEIGIKDMELIENARHARQRLSAPGNTDSEPPVAGRPGREVAVLLGRMYSQKVFFRPGKTPCVSG